MVVAPGRATFRATAIGTAPITYQWNKNGVTISGATSATYTTPATTTADNGASFTVTVTNSVNSFTSPSATLTVTSAPVAPTILGQPLSIQVTLGNAATFYVVATGTSPLSYQWSKNGTPISGATDTSYTTPATRSADNNAQFSVTVMNSAGTVTSGAATVTVGSQVYGLGGFLPALPGSPSDIVGVQFRFLVSANESQAGRIIFGSHRFATPGSNITYLAETNVYSGSQTFANGGCTTWPLLGDSAGAHASLRNATPDYVYSFGQQPAVGSAINTSDPVNWPVQTYLIDNISNLWKSDSISQFNINGVEALVTIQQSATLTDVSGFQRCGLRMLSTTYRTWTITTQVTGHDTVVNQIILPDADARYIAWWEPMNFYSEFLNGPGTFAVQYWDFAYIRESSPVWTPVSTFTTHPNYDGSGQDFGVHVVSVNGQDRVEFSNAPGNSYLPGNLPFSISLNAFILTLSSVNVGEGSSTGTFSVGTEPLTPSSATWTASSNAPWITITSGSAGAGNGTVTYIVAANTGPTRSGTITVAGQIFTITQAGTATINSGGIVPVCSSSATVQPGSWFSIYGSDFATSTTTWSGDFPTLLGGVSVAVNNRPAYLWYVSPTQINAQAPDDSALGPVSVVVTNGNGTSTSTVTLASISPCFSVLGDGKHVAGVIPTPNGTGAYGGGTYDLVGPPGAFAFSTRPVIPGETLLLYGVGFGPTNPPVPAGQAFSGAAPMVQPVTIFVGSVPANAAFSGMVEAGLYQFNVTVPQTGVGDVALEASVGDVQTNPGPLIYVAPAGLTPGIIAYWPADNSALDVISGLSGSLVNGATFAPGKVNQAFSLNGVSSYVLAAGAEQAVMSGPRTLLAWVFPNSGSGLGVPLLTGGAAGAGDFFGITGTSGGCSGSGQYKLYIDHWGTPCYVGNNTLTPNTWSQVAVTFDGTTVRFYINGVPSQTITGQMYSYGLATYVIGGNAIGGSTTGASFNGLLDEIQIYDRALSAAEIEALYLR
jgi:uncharacterized protein (TIGR03437 family)